MKCGDYVWINNTLYLIKAVDDEDVLLYYNEISHLMYSGIASRMICIRQSVSTKWMSIALFKMITNTKSIN